MSLLITFLMLLALILVCGWLVVSANTIRGWAEPDDGLVDLQAPPEEEGWHQQAEAIADREGVERLDLARIREVD